MTHAITQGVNMIIVMNPKATKKNIEFIINKINNLGLIAHPLTGTERTVIGAIGDTKAKDSFKTPTRSRNQEGNRYTLNSSTMFWYLTTQTKNIAPVTTAFITYIMLAIVIIYISSI